LVSTDNESWVRTLDLNYTLTFVMSGKANDVPWEIFFIMNLKIAWEKSYHLQTDEGQFWT
jgi:hypothetical protein